MPNGNNFQEIRRRAKIMAAKTEDAYSYHRYKNWLAVITDLYRHGWDDQEVEAILRSKWTRWAADQSNSGKASVKDLERWMDKNATQEQVTDLVRRTFPDGGCAWCQQEIEEPSKTAIACRCGKKFCCGACLASHLELTGGHPEMDRPKYDLTHAVFQVKGGYDYGERQDLCYVFYVRLTGGVSRGAAIPVMKKILVDRYRTPDVKFAFWCDGSVATGGSPLVLAPKSQKLIDEIVAKG